MAAISWMMENDPGSLFVSRKLGRAIDHAEFLRAEQCAPLISHTALISPR